MVRGLTLAQLALIKHMFLSISINVAAIGGRVDWHFVNVSKYCLNSLIQRVGGVKHLYYNTIVVGL